MTAEDIKKYGYRTLAEILQSVRGFYTSNDRSYSYAGVRGFSRPGDYNTRLLLIVDGHRINDGIYNQAYLGTEFPLDVDLIDRVEIIRGPSHSLYGSNAFLGVINVITRNAADLDGLELSGEAGSFQSFKERASYGREFSSGAQVLLSGTHVSSRGQDLYFKEYDSPLSHKGRADSCDSQEGGSLFATLKHRGFSLQGLFGSEPRMFPQPPTGPSSTTTGPISRMRGPTWICPTNRISMKRLLSRSGHSTITIPTGGTGSSTRTTTP